MKEYIEECIMSYGEEINNNTTKTHVNGFVFNVNVHLSKLI